MALVKQFQEADGTSTDYWRVIGANLIYNRDPESAAKVLITLEGYVNKNTRENGFSPRSIKTLIFEDVYGINATQENIVEQLYGFIKTKEEFADAVDDL